LYLRAVICCPSFSPTEDPVRMAGAGRLPSAMFYRILLLQLQRTNSTRLARGTRRRNRRQQKSSKQHPLQRCYCHVLKLLKLHFLNHRCVIVVACKSRRMLCTKKLSVATTCSLIIRCSGELLLLVEQESQILYAGERIIVLWPKYLLSSF
jgi:hypothetical protein